MPQVSLERVLEPFVDSGVALRARDYYRAGRVTEVSVDANSVTARVRGSKPYSVLLRLNDELDFGCTCRYAEDGQVCKHILATALYVDERAPMSVAQTDPAPTLLPLAAALDDLDEDLDDLDDDFDEFDDDDGDDGEEPTEWDRALHSSDADTKKRESVLYERHRWQRLLPSLAHPVSRSVPSGNTETWYLVDGNYAPYSYRHQEPTLRIVIAQRRRLKGGRLSKPTAVGRVPEQTAPDGAESIVWTLARSSMDSAAYLTATLCRQLLPELCRTGRVGMSLTVRGDDIQPLSWDLGLPWQLVLEIDGEAKSSPSDDSVEMRGQLERATETGKETLPLSQLWEVLDVDLLVLPGVLSPLARGHARWVRELAREPLRPLESDLKGLVSVLLSSPAAPRLRNPETVGFSVRHATPTPRVRLRLPEKARQQVRGDLAFVYDGQEAGSEARLLMSQGNVLVRDYEKEARLVAELRELGFGVKPTTASDDSVCPFELEIHSEALHETANALIERGVRVLLEGRAYRRAKAWHPIIESEQDWFNLKGGADFDGFTMQMPELLEAVRRKERWIRLGDGSLSMLPEEWYASLSKLALLLPPKKKALKLHATQALMVEGALQGAVELSSDAGFDAMKQRFERFKGIAPLREPKTFRGELRGYQRLALGWLDALDELGFGGCLADDMGLGKTVVVLAWLLQRKAKRTSTKRGAKKASEKTPPSLLVVPKSLLFNWQREAERFAPGLKLLLHHGLDRKPVGPHFLAFDVVLTSYGTLRRDAAALAGTTFDIVILDEAHGIKNAWTESHKAARALTSHGRLALTGTPIENHLGELWNLLSFLNPGVFDGFSHLRKTFENRRPSQIALENVVLTAVKPFILRRTKSEVASDLPERVEKTLHITLSKEERRTYDELAEYYKKRILARRAADRETGSNRGRPTDNARRMAEALQALLRLRQAACHPALIDERKRDEPSTKLTVLIEQLSALRAEGHKALVFSQFTKLLQLLAPRLDAAGIPRAYLDGKTTNREAAVQRFQDDPDISVFLISLKAGGVGLNLVAADYVFLLDPWWNPASEAQAIDRAHRIGQQRRVIAYRLLCEDTVEQKVAALQQEKRELAEALFGDSSNFAAKISREDLEALLEA